MATQESKFNKAMQSLNKVGLGLWNYIKKARLDLMVLFGVLFFDLISKILVANFAPLQQGVEVIHNFFYIYYTHNDKAAFGSDWGLSNWIGVNGVMIFFVLLTVVAIIIFSVILYKLRYHRKWVRIMLAMIIAGAFGNLIDRIFLGYVRDFIYFEYFGANIPFLGGRGFAIFNIADSGLVIGMIGLFIYILFMYNKDYKRVMATKLSSKLSDNDSSDVKSEDNTTHEDNDATNVNNAINVLVDNNTQDNNTSGDKQ